MNYFEADPYPDNAKILFIGPGMSTHTVSWIDLLSKSRFNVRLFSIPAGGVPPMDWQVRTYVCEPSPQLPAGLDPAMRQSFYPTPEEIRALETELEKRELVLYERNRALETNILFQLFLLLKTLVNFLGKRLQMPLLAYDYSRYRDLEMPELRPVKAASPEEWLATIIQDWQPDIIHTLGLFDGQGGAFYYQSCQRFRLRGMGKWILQLRGGSDLTLRKYDPDIARQIREMFTECTEIITDNYANIDYIKQLGMANKIASIAPVPGTGGVDTTLDVNEIPLPSQKERIIVWPKAYESMWSKGLPVMEAIKIAWDAIKPCKIYMTASVAETEAWSRAMLPTEIRESCILLKRIPRHELFALMKRARVLLIPSLVDGVPNSLYEAMANRVFPIVSPLDSITPVVSNETNVLFARNLYPTEISAALIRAMSDDALVDAAAKNNFELVKRIVSREQISKQVTKYYQDLSLDAEAVHLNSPLVTVITPTYNRASLLPETIESVLAQDYPNIEYIVLDDGSKDQTKQAVEEYAGKIIFESHANMGETRTVNKGFQMANGEFVCVVNSDDPILPGAITTLVRAIQSDPEPLVAYPDWIEIDPASRPIKEMNLPDYDIRTMLKVFNVAMGPATLFRRSALDQYGYRDPQRKYTGDLEFWFRLACHGKLIHVPRVLATHRTHPDSASVSDKSSRMAAELISMTASLFEKKHLPVELLRERKHIMSRVFYVSSFYCPGEPFKKLRYRSLAFVSDPVTIIKQRILMFLDRLLAAWFFLLHSIKFLLRITLPRTAYLGILSWWMRVTGQK